MKRILRVIAVILLLVAAAFLLGVPTWDIGVPKLSEKTILTGGVVGAMAGFIGVLIAQYLAGKRHSEALWQGRELEAQRAHEDALQKYFEQVGKLLTDPSRPLRRSTLGDNLSTVARAQTLSILEGLNDPTRKRILLQFLYESALINRDKPVVGLIGANLSKANLNHAKLSGTKLSEADLTWADLSFTDLNGADLNGADLYNAKLIYAKLNGANLSRAKLIHAEMSNAKLRAADLRDADPVEPAP